MAGVFLLVAAYGATFVVAIVFTWILAPFIRIILDFKPRIVKETTRRPKPYLVSGAIEAWEEYFEKDDRESSIETSFDDLILPNEVKKCIKDMACSVRDASEDGTPFRNIILHGPRGVGKSTAAKKMAEYSGLEFARTSGRDVQAEGEEGVSQIQTLFSWARQSSKGILIFIDEADAFLASKDSSLMKDTSLGHDALSAFLYNASKAEKGIMLVLAANSYRDLDAEVLAHFEERVYIPLPDASCRRDLVRLYFDLHVQQHVHRSRERTYWIMSKLARLFQFRPLPLPLSIEENLMSGEHLEEVVVATRGLSGGDIRDLMVAMQRALDGSADGCLTFADAWTLIEAKVKHHLDRQVAHGEHTLNTALSCVDGGEIDLQDVTFV